MKTRQEILDYVKERGCTIPHHKSEYRMQGHPEEFADFIYTLQGVDYQNYLEVGVAAAGTTRMLNDFFWFENLVLIDNNEQESEYPYRRVNLRGIEHIEIIGDSTEFYIVGIIERLRFRYDLMYIDGDHSYEGVKADFNNYYMFLSPGGYIAFHDTVIFPGVKKFIAELKDHDGLEFIGEWYKKMGIALFKNK